MSDIRCLVCNEPWDEYGLMHGDVMAWQADHIKAGHGCPCCIANGFTQNLSYVKPKPLVQFLCSCCNLEITIDQNDIEYNGEELSYEESISKKTEDGLVCEDCFYEYYHKCAECELTLHDDECDYINNSDIYLCDRCRAESYSSCEDCGDVIHNEDIMRINDSHICDACYYLKYKFCDNCGNDYLITDDVEGYCSEKCYEADNAEDV